jgi:hypothetical protein
MLPPVEGSITLSPQQLQSEMDKPYKRFVLVPGREVDAHAGNLWDSGVATGMVVLNAPTGRTPIHRRASRKLGIAQVAQNPHCVPPTLTGFPRVS